MAEPKFIPKDGQVDYTNIRYAPVVNTVVTKDGKVLLVQRSQELRLYPGFWNGISGFLDDKQSIEEKVGEELRDELGIEQANILKLDRGHPFIQEAPEYDKTWLVVPVLVEINTDMVGIDWEASQAKWFEPSELKKLNLLPGFETVIAQLLDI